MNHHFIQRHISTRKRYISAAISLATNTMAIICQWETYTAEDCVWTGRWAWSCKIKRQTHNISSVSYQGNELRCQVLNTCTNVQTRNDLKSQRGKYFNRHKNQLDSHDNINKLASEKYENMIIKARNIAWRSKCASMTSWQLEYILYGLLSISRQSAAVETRLPLNPAAAKWSYN